MMGNGMVSVVQAKYEQDPKKCKFCGGVIPYSKRDQTCCNKDCSAQYLTGNLIGKRFHRITVVRQVGGRILGGGAVEWECRCDCGGKVVASTARIKRGSVKSCGCLKERAGQESPFWGGCGKIPGSYWYRVVTGAKKRGIPLEVTLPEAWGQYEMQGGKCALSGLPINFTECATRDRNNSTTASLDRIDSSKGYTLGNIQWIHKRLQGMKSNMPETEFLTWCTLVASHKSSNAQGT